MIEWLTRNLEMLGGFFFGSQVDRADHYVPPVLFGTCVLLGLGWTLLRKRGWSELVWAAFPWSIVASFGAMMTYGTYGPAFLSVHRTLRSPCCFRSALIPVALSGTAA